MKDRAMWINVLEIHIDNGYGFSLDLLNIGTTEWDGALFAVSNIGAWHFDALFLARLLGRIRYRLRGY